MQVLDVHSAFLSNYEVLQLLEEDVALQEREINAFKQAQSSPSKRRNQGMQKGVPYFDYQAGLNKIVPENLRTLQLETLKYLKQPDLPCTRQNPANIKKTLAAVNQVQCKPEEPGSLGSHALAKTERLMLVNLAPQAVVDLTVIVDDLDSRFTEEAQAALLEALSWEASGVQEAQTEKADHAVGQVKAEGDEKHRAEDNEQVQEDKLEQEVYGEEYENLDETQYMPDEENDLVDEGMGDGGREEEIREIDEVAD